MVFVSIPSPSSGGVEIGPLNLRLYGVMIALGVLAAVWLAQRQWRSRGGDPEDITVIALWAVPAGLIGARLYHVITDWSRLYADSPQDIVKIWQGGLGIPGGIALGALVGAVVAHRRGLDWRTIADCVAPALPLAQAIGRLGNYFNQELYGRPTDLPWGLEIDSENRPVEYLDQETFHPTFLYEGLWNIGVMFILLWIDRRHRLKPGRLFGAYLGLYFVGRLWVESIRIDTATEILGLRVNIWLSLVMIVVSLIWVFWGGSPVAGEAPAVVAGDAAPDTTPARRAVDADASDAELDGTETAAGGDETAAGSDGTAASPAPGSDETAAGSDETAASPTAGSDETAAPDP
ncbi:MAG: prolipoprotein diacylglyceryl transferase [Actinobacteria bacterium]|nr:MAG: prolipoprotein diacylglyceryl transferase [Actinomycetota bacterium]RIK08616.1 MAG: prolipoprotein diacylglyceryl transferase [Acidobacteriota bacterium]